MAELHLSRPLERTGPRSWRGKCIHCAKTIDIEAEIKLRGHGVDIDIKIRQYLHEDDEGKQHVS